MSEYQDRTMIVPATIADTARNLAISIIGYSVKDMWTVPLADNATGVLTHYINSGAVHVDFLTLIENAEVLAEAAGITIEQAEFILAMADISEESADTAMERLNLKPYRDEPTLD